MTKKTKKKSTLSPYAYYSSLGIQMACVIFFFTWLGNYLDQSVKNQTPWWTLGLSLFGIFAGLYLILKSVIKKQNNE